MKGIEEFKEKITFDEDFAKKFSRVENLEDIISIATKEGEFDFTEEELQDDSISDDILESVAGGIGRRY